MPHKLKTHHDSAWMVLQMAKCERRIQRELALLVTHPMQDYQPGSPHLERLYQQIELARKFQWPSTVTYNV